MAAEQPTGARVETISSVKERSYVVLARKRDNRLQLLVSQINSPEGLWTFTGGEKKAGDPTTAEGASRELLEETGINLNSEKLIWGGTVPVPINQYPQSLTLFIATETEGEPFPEPQLIQDEKLGYSEMSNHVWMNVEAVADLVKDKKILLPKYMDPAILLVLLKLEETGFINHEENTIYRDLFAHRTRRGIRE